MAAIDEETITGGVPGEELMERAGREIVRRMLEMFPGLAPPARIAICCGKGNNGGDGLVMARLLAGLGFEVSVMLLALPEEFSPDARLNHGRLPNAVEVACCPREEWADRWRRLCRDAGLAVDAVFGTGIQPPVRQPYVSLFDAFNSHEAPVLSVDVPSGVCGDTGRVDPVAVRADATVTVGLPKLGLLLPPGRDHVGELAVVDIGFGDEAVQRHTPAYHYLRPEDYAALLPARPSDVHKYRCGTVLIVSGSRAFGGAAVLTGLGALRSGAGLVTVAVPECLEVPARIGLPEALIAPLAMTDCGTIAPPAEPVLDQLLERKHAVAVGPGLGDDQQTDRFVVDWLRRLSLPVVVDADGFSAYGRLQQEPAFGAAEVVLTPHAGELARVLGRKPAEVEKRRLELVPELAKRWGVTLLLKGSPAVTADRNGSLVFNPSGDDALAHGGTGDVLTGLIGGLLAQGCRGRDAALLGAYLHGRAGQIISTSISRRSVLAREIADSLGEAMADLEEWRPRDATPSRDPSA
jgi:NAD(P)H-hydrate epimerase